MAARPYPLWLPDSRVPPRGVSRLGSTASAAFGSVAGHPASSVAHPTGIAFSCHLVMSILTTATSGVAMSSEQDGGLRPGAVNTNGLVATGELRPTGGITGMGGARGR